MTYLAIAAIIAALIGWQPLLFGISVVTIVGILLILEITGFLKKIPGLSVLSGHIKRGTAIMLLVVLAVVVYGGASLGGIMSGGGITVPSLPAQQATIGDTYSGEYEFFPSDGDATTYAGSGVVYVLDKSFIKSSEEESKYDFMKILADGNTGKLLAPGGTAQANAISVSSGEFSKTQLSAKTGDHIALCGYLDNTPAAAENISFCKDVVLTGFNTETSKWNWYFAATGTTDYTWYSYATTAIYDSSDAARTSYNETETTAIEKTFTMYTFPTYNGEGIYDASLYLEAPSSNAGAIKKITITSPPDANGNKATVEYTSLQSTSQMSSNDPRFIAAPSLTTGTDTMYYIGKFPRDAVRTSSSEKAKFTIETTYDHPASSSVLMYFKPVMNSGAKSVTGGHFDWGATIHLNMTQYGSDGWAT